MSEQATILPERRNAHGLNENGNEAAMLAPEKVMLGSTRLHIAALLLLAFTGNAQQASIQARSVTITEPGIYRLSDLFSHADTVALVKVISGDTEAYEIPIYKGQVVQAFKGVKSGDVIYFGPYLGTELGSEYILFLKSAANSPHPKDKAAVGSGQVRYSNVFDEGYSSMLTSYECVFDGSSRCDYAVRVCTDYIKLPKSLSTFPPKSKETPFGCRWVRRDDFLQTLTGLPVQSVDDKGKH